MMQPAFVSVFRASKEMGVRTCLDQATQQKLYGRNDPMISTCVCENPVMRKLTVS